MGVRSSDAELTRLLRHALDRYLVEDPAAPLNFSLEVASKPAGFHALYRGECPVLRTRDPDRLLNALRTHLDATLEKDEDELVVFDASALVQEGRAILVPERARSALLTFDRRLRAAGMTPVDAPRVAVHLADGELVIEPQVHFNAEVLAELRRALPAGRRSEEFVSAGRFPVDRWVVGEHLLHAGLGTRAPAIVEAWSSVSAAGRLRAPELVPSLRDMLAPVRVIPCRNGEERTLVRVLVHGSST